LRGERLAGGSIIRVDGGCGRARGYVKTIIMLGNGGSLAWWIVLERELYRHTDVHGCLITVSIRNGGGSGMRLAWRVEFCGMDLYKDRNVRIGFHCLSAYPFRIYPCLAEVKNLFAILLFLCGRSPRECVVSNLMSCPSYCLCQALAVGLDLVSVPCQLLLSWACLS
jgi:hypothetical protein